uniref:Transcription factor IIIB 50 kDa subunit n=1 Tax=Neogobius melanostomus TaxID=47308 RepID=A0A8C6SZ75_9GOBI
MPPVGLKCRCCGSSNIVEDDLYAQSQSVCADCGTVCSEGRLANDPVGGSVVSYSYTTQQSKKPCPNLIKGLHRVQALCRVLRLNSEIEKSSQTYFNQACNHESFIFVRLTKKEALAGCCVLISCRMYNWPITAGTIAYLVDTDPASLFRVYLEAVKTLNISVPAPSVSDVIEAHCQAYKITSEHVPEELAADTKELTKRALALVELAAESWIVTGRRPVPIMMAATYLSWQSLQPTKLRQKMTLEKFCQLAKVDKNRPATKRVSEMKEMLCKLGNELPWKTREITPHNVVQQVEDILNYRFALLRNALKSYADSSNADPPQFDIKEIPESEHSLKTESCTVETEQQAHSATDSCDEPNWGKRVLFAPPCVVNAKKKKREQSNQLEVTGDEEISDSEISSYIRTPQEVRNIELTKTLLLKE